MLVFKRTASMRPKALILLSLGNNNNFRLKFLAYILVFLVIYNHLYTRNVFKQGLHSFFSDKKHPNLQCSKKAAHSICVDLHNHGSTHACTQSLFVPFDIYWTIPSLLYQYVWVNPFHQYAKC